MRVTVRRMSVLAAAAVLALTGCGGTGDDGAAPPDGPPSPSASDTASDTPSDTASDTPSDTATTGDGAVEIEVEIEHGRVTPSGQRVDVEVGQRIRFVVDSDAADEIHVHSTPDHAFAFKAGADDREFEFTLDRPGVVEAELHELGDVVVTLAAQP